jgi:hypothetical protein
MSTKSMVRCSISTANPAVVQLAIDILNHQDRNKTTMSQHYQSSSSHRGLVTNTEYRCTIAYYTWACGHETSETQRYRLCWKCNDLDVGLCNPEPVEIDKTSKCAPCKARREQERRRRDRERAQARDKERQDDRRRERSPRGGGTWERRRSY